MRYIDDRSAFYRYLYENCHCVNAGQSKEFRRFKYKLARALGANRAWATRVKDWRKNNFAKYFGFSSYDSMMIALENLIKEEDLPDEKHN